VKTAFPPTAYVVTDLMKGVVEIGTEKGTRAGPASRRQDRDFYQLSGRCSSVSYPNCCAASGGRDDFKPIGHDATGGQVALPIWLSYMQEALRSVPVHDFEPPPG